MPYNLVGKNISWQRDRRFFDQCGGGWAVVMWAGNRIKDEFLRQLSTNQTGWFNPHNTDLYKI